MAGLRLVVGAEVKAGNEHSANHTLPGLLKILDELPLNRKPKMVRGDCGFGADGIMAALQARQQPYLFKLKLSKNVKRHIERIFWDAGWRDAGQGWEGKDGELRLSGWDAARRVIVLRRPLQGEVLITQDDNGQGLLGFIEADRKTGKRTTGYEYAVLVTNLDHEIVSLGQVYRDRADAENAFDELKNQWGWGGFTTHDLHRCQLSARAVALIYNWWSLFVRLTSPETRREAITSRPWLMSSVGRKTEHAGQTTLTLTGLHAHFGKAKTPLMLVSALLKGLGDPHSGAVQRDDRLDVVLRPYQVDHRPNRAGSNAPISRTPCEWNRVTAVFRLKTKGVADGRVLLNSMLLR